MDMSGEQHIATGQETVWQALNDIEVLQTCIPGCEAIALAADGAHDVALTAAVGPLKARFKGKLHLVDADPPYAYRIIFEGQGGAAGFAKGVAAVALTPDGADGAQTRLTYEVHAQVGGKLAQIGSRLIDAAAKKLADDFFAAFNRRVAPRALPSATPPPSVLTPTWLVLLVGILVVVALYLVSR